MSVGIAEIDAVPAARPSGAAFDGDALFAQPLLPLRQFISGNGEGHVQRSVAVVWGNRAARHAHGLERGAAAKQQQYALPADVVGAKPRVAGQLRKAQHVLVKPRRTVEIVDVETG